MRPVILDFDSSVRPLSAHELRLPLAAWQEKIRFGCTKADYAHLETHLARLMPENYGCVFTGSGDYHHLSLFLLKHLAKKNNLPPDSLDLIVCDNHPDNMRYLFGLHCGSWVTHAARIACVRHIHVLGITSADISLKHAWENSLGPFFRKKLFYWSIQENAHWLGVCGRSMHSKSFASADDLLAGFLSGSDQTQPIYLSIDKDVFSPELVRTNWDQGVFELRHMRAMIRNCAGRLLGADITGEMSDYAYASRFKKFLNYLDKPHEERRLPGQNIPDSTALDDWKDAQHELNMHLLELLEQCFHNAAP